MGLKTLEMLNILILVIAFSSLHGLGFEIEDLVESSNGFGVHLFNKIAASRNAKDNIFISPESIFSALSMTSLGARGQTLGQMLKVMGVNNIKNRNEIIEKLNSILLKNDTGVTLEIANKLYGEKGYPFLKSFEYATEKYYDAKFEEVEFTKTENARKEINKWVEQKTHNMIRDLLPQGSITPSTRLVLVNALYFKGKWKHAFEKRFTQKGKFHLSKSVTTEVQYMRIKDTFKMADLSDLNVKGLELPYENDRFRMLIFMAYNSNFEINLNEDILKSFDKYAYLQNDLHVTIPKFKILFETKLKVILSKMGMPDLFDAKNANLSGLDGNMGLSVSDIFHKAFVEVNEEGTKAAAATGGVVMLRAMLRPATFTVDRPFIFIIQENKTKAVLFVGKVQKPNTE